MNKAEEYTSKISDELLEELTPEESEKIEKRMLLAARIADAIKAKGWKKKDLANALSKQPSEITKLLSGTHNFTTDTLWDIERVLGIELVALDNRTKEQVITFQISATEVVEVDKPASFEQLFFSDVFTLASASHKQLKRGQKRSAQIYKA